jgi:hypothetical protein
MKESVSKRTHGKLLSLSLVLMVAMLISGVVYGEFKPGTPRVVPAGEALDVQQVLAVLHQSGRASRRIRA